MVFKICRRFNAVRKKKFDENDYDAGKVNINLVKYTCNAVQMYQSSFEAEEKKQTHLKSCQVVCIKHNFS